MSTELEMVSDLDHKKTDETEMQTVSIDVENKEEEPPKSREEWKKKFEEPAANDTNSQDGDDKPAPSEHPYREHQGANRQYMRDMILGVNDGLVSMFLLIIGLTGGGVGTVQLLLAGITGSVAGAISMALGEYMATKSQAEVYSGDIELEKEHFKYHRALEIAQLRAIMQNDLQLEGDLLEQVVDKVGNNDTALLKIMMAFEFGLNENDQRSPFKAMLVSGALFIAGSLPTWIPFCFTNSVTEAVIASLVLSVIALFIVGAMKTIMTRGSWVYGGLENLIVGAIGGGVSYAVGVIYEYARS